MWDLTLIVVIGAIVSAYKRLQVYTINNLFYWWMLTDLRWLFTAAGCGNGDGTSSSGGVKVV